jgi:hypothetical protein
MHLLINKVSKNVFSKGINDIDSDVLRNASNKYPYWSIPRLLLAVKEEEQQTAAALFVYNWAWFDYILHTNEKEEETPAISGTKLRDILSSDTPADESTPIFEPIHSVDYFASQGIKLDLEAEPKDKFTRQLKSFTDWLKVMKKVNPEKLATENIAEAERKVQGMAETSISTREVITEAMAEVWHKQGNHAKAIDMYQKLSLINPAKSAYFAAKIEQIKNS